MFELQVGGYLEARKSIADGWPTRVVRLLPAAEIGESVKPDEGAGHLIINVSDTNLVGDDQIIPTMDHLRTIFTFTENLTDDDRLFVHCFAGIGRSAAVAIGICMQHGMAYKDAFDYVRGIRDIMNPNRDFIRLIDEYFVLDGQLIAYAKQHKPKF